MTTTTAPAAYLLPEGTDIDTLAEVPTITVKGGSLKPGMVLSRDLISRGGALLLAADILLDERLIQHIRDFAGGEDHQVVVHVSALRSARTKRPGRSEQ